MARIITLLSIFALAYGKPQRQETGTDRGQGEGTHGVTDGEPGHGEHCCGMKGLGGAFIEVLCAPTQVAKGENFTVNIAFKTDVLRPTDVHIDLVNAEFKKGEIGSTSQFSTQTGNASHTMTLPTNAAEPFLWKVFLTPRGEPFPNMLAETGFPAKLGPKTLYAGKACPKFANFGSNYASSPNVDYVLLSRVVEVPPYPANGGPNKNNDHPSYPDPTPDSITIGSKYPVSFTYNLVSEGAASISASLMWKGNNTWISSDGMAAQPGKHDATLNIPVPADLGLDNVYVVVTMVPVGGDWNSRLAEDRTYEVALVKNSKKNPHLRRA